MLAETIGLGSFAFGRRTRSMGIEYGLIRRCVALTSSVRRRVHSSRLRLQMSRQHTNEGHKDDTYVTDEYSSSVKS